VHDFGKCAADAGFHFLRRRLPAPLPQEFAVSIEHHHAPVAVAIGKVNVTVFRIAGDARRLVEPVVARVQVLAPLCAVDGIEHALLADLHQEFSVVGVFLHHAVAVGRDPDVVVLIDRAAMWRRGQHVPIAPRTDHLAFQVEDHHRRRPQAGFLFLLRDVAAIDDEHVVVVVNVYTRELPGNPAFRQRLGPPRIDYESRRSGFRYNGTRGGGGSSTDIHVASLVVEKKSQGTRHKSKGLYEVLHYFCLLPCLLPSLLTAAWSVPAPS
jgi:hypothetical protein